MQRTQQKVIKRFTEQGSATLVALGGVAVGVIAVLLVWLVVLTMNKNEPAPDSSAPARDAAAPAPASAPSVAAPSVAAPTATVTMVPRPSASAARPGDVRGLAGGLFCRDLKARGYSYVAAIDYWRVQGQPNQMDADRNGIPCETVYSRADVGQYWRGREVRTVASVPVGLLCRDLVSMGASYGDSVTYWWYSGMPSRMDADGNGIPCETVYPAVVVNAFWRQ
ncbi:hypothetical protein [Kribbella sp. DT2]|uniref:hypothetical protein n=1 Tax=Kribbella sp. DT2 TaxID=3393427 RepID=UPI003CF37D05